MKTRTTKKMPQKQNFSFGSKAFLGFGIVGVAAFFGIETVFAEDKKPEVVKVDYDKVRKELADIIAKDENLGPTFVRLAWHTSGTYNKDTKDGGSNHGSIRHHPEKTTGANAGLPLVMDILETVKKNNPGLSYGDLYTLAGVVAIEVMHGPKVPWRSGRVDGDPTTAVVGRLPDADKGTKHATLKHIRDVFYRMGFNDREIVALIGAHTLGRCHTTSSGYSGPWTQAPTMWSNSFFTELTENEWKLKKWSGPEQYEDKTGTLMMLPADIALLNDPVFSKIVKEYAADEAKFNKEFSAAFAKMLELGVPAFEKKGWW